MKKSLKGLMFLAAVAVVVSCGKKQQQEEIIIEKIVEKPKTEVRRVTKPDVTSSVKWVDGNSYSYSLHYETLDTLPAVESYDELYRDNAITLTIKRGDGSEVCTKRVTKSSFSGILPDKMKHHGVLLNMVLDKSDRNNLYFVASIGAPDESYEDFVMVQYILDRFGNTQVAAYVQKER